MLKKTVRMVSNFIQWLFDTLLTSKQKHYVKNILTDNQKAFIKNIFKSGKVQTYLRQIKKVKYRLYNLGFEKRAYEELKHMLIDTEDHAMKKIASWELAVWHANRQTVEDANKCIKFLQDLRKLGIDKARYRESSILLAECYDLIGDVKEAKKVISQTLENQQHPDLYLAYANLEATEEDRVHWINKAFIYRNLSPISMQKQDDVLAYDRLFSIGNTTSMDKVKVTIIIPVYNAETVIHTSIRSLLNQTWGNLEIIVVDDCSTDNTIAIVEDFVKEDNRVSLIKLTKNGGPYVARNYALLKATGDFITINDADDWSHPEKIEKQVLHLLKNNKIIANTSQQARASSELKFHRRGKPGLYLFSNMSSFMFRREPVMEKLGFWDSVRFAGDSEFIMRFKKVFGERALAELETGPLSFQRQSEDSLTGNSIFGFPGYLMGVRKEYREAHNYYYSIAPNLRFDFPQKRRPFEVPEPMWTNREEKLNGRRHFDVIIVSDFRFDGGSTLSSVEEIKAQKQKGLRTGLFQMYRYDYNPSKLINSKVRELLNGDDIQLIVYGEKVSCDLLILRYPPVLQDWQKFTPDVEAKNICVIMNQTPMSDYGPDGVRRYDISVCEQRLQEYFVKSGTWYPIGPLIRETLVTHHSEELPSIHLSTENWVNIINVDEWRRQERPPSSKKIRIGRHSRGEMVKWPIDPEELLMIYPDSEEYEVHILGGAAAPEQVLGRIPSNWNVFEFGAMHPRDFLATLDIFVYYTHPDWIESFGRVIIEAMAVGVPVIIPPVYKDLFGEAAVYAEPQDVKKEIEKLISDESYYHSKVENALQYVNENFGYRMHEVRINKFLND
ncbi:glycosyltransferase [Bacillus alkalicellulosilyticus]|uniref:glycosyltransferase n=1 Tax=Alkalihalobacterium alkalicellulosilyticum TaxID=1912214 RepID=UPI000998C441|nr:glycosyltransferase [Bacillus alkalicellulosilyticus]